MQGHLDTELSEVGYEQAKGAAAMLRDKNISAIVCSDLIRARETARVIGEELGLEPSIDARLRETNLGDWQGMSSVEVDEEFPGARAIWRHDPTWAPPQGESRVDVAKRARPDFNPGNPTSSLEFTPDNVDGAKWYFDGWNMGAHVVGGAGADV